MSERVAEIMAAQHQRELAAMTFGKEPLGIRGTRHARRTYTPVIRGDVTREGMFKSDYPIYGKNSYVLAHAGRANWSNPMMITLTITWPNQA